METLTKGSGTVTLRQNLQNELDRAAKCLARVREIRYNVDTEFRHEEGDHAHLAVADEAPMPVLPTLEEQLAGLTEINKNLQYHLDVLATKF